MITLSHDDFYPTNAITFAKMLLNNQWIFNNMTLDEFAKFVDEVNEQKPIPQKFPRHAYSHEIKIQLI